MRFLCMCIAVLLSGLLAVRGYFTPDPTKAAANILRGVSASDRSWRIILSQNLNPTFVDSDGMLAELGLLTPGAGITLQKIVERLVTHKSTTGTQFKFGIRALGVALENQFTKTLLVHSYFAFAYAGHEDATLKSMRVCISSIQTALVNFVNKLAFFGHPIDYFWDLNNIINAFLDTHESNWESLTMDELKEFLTVIIKNTKYKVTSQEHESLDIQNLFNQLKLINATEEELNDIFSLGGHQLYGMTNEIDTYAHVNVGSMRLDFIEKRFKIIKYSALENPNEEEI